MNLGKILCAELKRNLEKGGRPRLPASGDLLWRWFNELSGSRSWTDIGPGPITFGEIVAYARVMRWQIEPHHVAILRDMDDAFLDYCRRERARALGNDRTVQPIDMTAGRFDALFG